MRNRTRLRRKEVAELAARLQNVLGLEGVFSDDEPLEVAEGPDRRFVLLGADVIGFFHGEEPFLTPRGLLRYPASRRFVTVDMGAVPYVTNGADVMGPGIADADSSLRADDLVWIREIRHGKPLAVGVALVDAVALRSKAKGKQVRTLFYVGDKVWQWGQEPASPPPS